MNPSEFPNLQNKKIAICEAAFDDRLEDKLSKNGVYVFVYPYSLVYFYGWLVKRRIGPDVIVGHLDRANEIRGDVSEHEKVRTVALQLIDLCHERTIFTSNGFPDANEFMKRGARVISRDYGRVIEELIRIHF